MSAVSGSLRPRRERPWVVGHRGASLEAPENTVPAFEAAARYQIEAIECDVQLTGDGAAVVFHDSDLRRIAGRPERPADLDLASMRRVDVGSWFDEAFRGTPVPLLEEALSAVGGVAMWLELKVFDLGRAAELADETVRVVRARQAESRVQILSFDRSTLDRIQRVAPDVACIRLLRAVPETAGDWERAVAGCVALDVDWRLVTRPFVQQTHRFDRAVAVYTCNTRQAVDHVLACGVDAITTDRPGWLAAVLAPGGANASD